jgi:hypothetical protein
MEHGIGMLKGREILEIHQTKTAYSIPATAMAAGRTDTFNFPITSGLGFMHDNTRTGTYESWACFTCNDLFTLSKKQALPHSPTFVSRKKDFIRFSPPLSAVGREWKKHKI